MLATRFATRFLLSALTSQTVPLSVRSSLDAQYDCFLPLTDASPRVRRASCMCHAKLLQDNEDSEETPALPSTLLLPLKNQCLMRVGLIIDIGTLRH